MYTGTVTSPVKHKIQIFKNFYWKDISRHQNLAMQLTESRLQVSSVQVAISTLIKYISIYMHTSIYTTPSIPIHLNITKW